MTNKRQIAIEHYDISSAEARNPGTQSERLATLWDMAYKQCQGFQSSGHSPHREHPAYQALLLMRLLAHNPNLPLPTLQAVCIILPLEAIQNPVIPLLILEGDWSDWDFKSFCQMREAAFATKQSCFPALTRVCHPHWQRERQIRAYEPTIGKAICGSEMCATCFPFNVAQLIERWRSMRGEV